MCGWKKSRYLRRVSASASEPPGSPASKQSISVLVLYQLSGEQESQQTQQASLSPSTMSRSRSFFNKLKRRLKFPSSLPGVEHCNNTADPASSESKSLTVSASELATGPHSWHSEGSTIQILGHDLSPLTKGSNVTTVSLSSHDSSDVLDTSFESFSMPIIQVSDSEPTASETPALPSDCAPHIPTPTSQEQALATIDVHAAILPQPKAILAPDVVEPSPQSSIVWDKALKIAKEKLGDTNLSLDLTNLASQSVEENIKAIIGTLNTLQEGCKEKKWSYTWRGKKVIVVEWLGKILKNVEKYSKVVDIAIQSSPRISALVWAGVWAIMRVCIYSTHSMCLFTSTNLSRFYG